MRFLVVSFMGGFVGVKGWLFLECEDGLPVVLHAYDGGRISDLLKFLVPKVGEDLYFGFTTLEEPGGCAGQA